MARLHRSTAEGLLLCAETLKVNLRARLNVLNPPPYKNSSKPGEYPRRRTGTGRESLEVIPSTLEEAVRTLKVRLRYQPQGWYMLFLERYRDRLGLEHTLREFLPLLRTLVKQRLRKG